MTPENPLGILYFGYDRSGRPGLGFAQLNNQSPVASHNEEWTEILAEILGKGLTPIMLKIGHQSEFLENVTAATKAE